MTCAVCIPEEPGYCEFCPDPEPSSLPEPIVGRDPGDENDFVPDAVVQLDGVAHIVKLKAPAPVTARTYTASYRTITRSHFATRTLTLSDSYRIAVEQAIDHKPGEGWVLCGLTELI